MDKKKKPNKPKKDPSCDGHGNRNAQYGFRIIQSWVFGHFLVPEQRSHNLSLSPPHLNHQKFSLDPLPQISLEKALSHLPQAQVYASNTLSQKDPYPLFAFLFDNKNRVCLWNCCGWINLWNCLARQGLWSFLTWKVPWSCWCWNNEALNVWGNSLGCILYCSKNWSQHLSHSFSYYIVWTCRPLISTTTDTVCQKRLPINHNYCSWMLRGGFLRPPRSQLQFVCWQWNDSIKENPPNKKK